MNFKSSKYFIEHNLNESINPLNCELIPKEIILEDIGKIDDETAIRLFKENPPSNPKELRIEGVDDLTSWKIHLIKENVKNHEQILFMEKIQTNAPYDNEDLKGLTVDSKGLVEINEFLQYILNNKIKGKYCFCLPIRTSKFRDQLNNSFFNLKKYKDSANIKIRLDPLIKYYNFQTNLEKISGKILNWDELSEVEENIPVLCKDFDNDVKTQIYWRRDGNKFHFTCEELPPFDEITKRGSRYYHAIYDTKIKKITHFDASTKIYSETEYLERLNMKIWDCNCKKFNKYYKIYRIDGEFGTEIFTLMVISYFCGNNDVKKYFEELSYEK